MAAPTPEPEAQASVLDRLLDDEPRVTREARGSWGGNARLKRAVKRDLEWLLNTKHRPNLPAESAHLARSLLAFGLPDFTSASLNSPRDQERLRRSIEEAIRRFEPRLSHVVVTLEGGRQFDRALRFRIDAMLRSEPVPEPVSFDSVLQLATKQFVVQGE